MTPWGLTALRRAATLAHTFPGIRLRLRDQDDTVLEVARTTSAIPHLISPCAFRHAVAHAHDDMKEGRVVAMIGLAPGVDPAIDVGVGSGDAVYPDGMYRIAIGDVDLHAFATTLSPRQCRQLVAARTTPVCRHPSGTNGLELRHDVATEITIVHAATARGEPPIERHALVEDLLIACAAEEIATTHCL